MDSESITTFVPDLPWFSYENFIDIRVSTTITRQARNWQQENFTDSRSEDKGWEKWQFSIQLFLQSPELSINACVQRLESFRLWFVSWWGICKCETGNERRDWLSKTKTPERKRTRRNGLIFYKMRVCTTMSSLSSLILMILIERPSLYLSVWNASCEHPIVSPFFEYWFKSIPRIRGTMMTRMFFRLQFCL